MNEPIIEGCVDSYASCVNAARGGADRLELCGHLAIGGTTPSRALFDMVIRDVGVKTNVLIRSRFGDFLYSNAEMEEMCMDIEYFASNGANGIVIGALTPDGELDEGKMREMISCASGKEITLHRAFDMSADPFKTLEKAKKLGIKTILTSGQQSDVVKGKELLKTLFEAAEGEIDIMAGCGVKKWNIREIHDYTGINVFHTTGRKGTVESGMRYRKSSVYMGLPSLSEYEIYVTDEHEFAECAKIVHSFQ